MGLMKKLTSAVVASSLVLGLVGTAGATSIDKVQAAANRMAAYELLKGVDASGDLALNANITRAQLVTILVRAFGQESSAKYLNGAAAFPDTANHPWASGYIALSKNIIEQRSNGKETVGLPDGTFNPDGNVTAAEAVAFLMKFVGAPRSESLSWPMNYIQGAVDAGIITADDKSFLEGVANAPATRGLAAYLADSAFYNYKLAEGTSVYRTFVDVQGPALTAEAPVTTMDASVEVTGTVSDAVVVHVGSMDNAATIADGKFTATVELKVGENDILVHAVDAVGNATEKTLKVTRSVGAVASIEAEAVTVTAGGTVEIVAVAKDAKGNVVPNVEFTGESTVGTYAAGKFTAGTTAGTGTLTLKAGEVSGTVNITVAAGALAKVEAAKSSVAKGEMVQLIAKDAHGNTVTGATFSQTSADAMLDSASGNFLASKVGTYTVSATKDGVTVTGTVGVYATTPTKLVVSAPESMIGNDATSYQVTVKAVDDNGNVVASYDKDITIAGEFTAKSGTSLTKKAANGVATFDIIADDVNSGTEIDIAATSATGVASVGTIKGSATTNVVAQVPTGLAFDAPKYLTVNDDAAGKKASVYVVDQNGEAMQGYDSWSVTVKVDGPATLTADGKKEVTVPATGDDAAENVTLYPIDVTSTGAVTLTATFTGFNTANATVQAAYGYDAKNLVLTQVTDAAVKASEQGVYKFKVELTDKNGVPRKAAADTTVAVKFDTADYAELTASHDADAANLTAATIGALTAQTSKTYNAVITTGNSHTYVGVVANKLTGSVPVSISSGDYTKASGSVAFKAGDATQVVFTRTTTIDVLKSSPSVTLTAQIKDAAGNNVAKEGVKVEFSTASSHVKLSGKADSLKATTDANGTATVDVTVLPYNASYDVVVKHDINDDGTYADAVTLTLAMKDAISKSISLQTWAADNTGRKSSFRAGESFKVRAYVKDNNDLFVSAAALETTLKLKGLALSSGVGANDGDVAETAVTWTQVTPVSGDPYYEATLTAITAGSYNFSVQETSVATEVKESRTIAFVPGTYNQLVVAETNSSGKLDVETGKVKAFTVRVADKYGNLVSPSQVSDEIVFDITLGDTDGTTDAGIYYDVRTAEASGSKTTGWKLLGGRNSATFYIVTNDANDAALTLSVTNVPAVPAGADVFDTSTTYTVTVAQ